MESVQKKKKAELKLSKEYSPIRGDGFHTSTGKTSLVNQKIAPGNCPCSKRKQLLSLGSANFNCRT